jgi:hypothetical protein
MRWEDEQEGKRWTYENNTQEGGNTNRGEQGTMYARMRKAMYEIIKRGN